MVFCSSCGSPAQGQFCPRCGAPVAGPAPGYAPPPAQAAGGMSENAACALCYAFGFITGILFLVLAPYNQNKTVRFHAFQSIFLHLAVIAIWVVAGAILPWAILFFMGPLIGVAAFVLWVFMLWKSYQGQKIKLPLIGDLAEKQA